MLFAPLDKKQAACAQAVSLAVNNGLAVSCKNVKPLIGAAVPIVGPAFSVTGRQHHFRGLRSTIAPHHAETFAKAQKFFLQGSNRTAGRIPKDAARLSNDCLRLAATYLVLLPDDPPVLLPEPELDPVPALPAPEPVLLPEPMPVLPGVEVLLPELPLPEVPPELAPPVVPLELLPLELLPLVTP
ncbi:MAG TPA: hypothetical protein VJT77_03255 [Burkholderiales bacterium]|nr:hypothetical protein [Burkholderiales bacterium]